MLLTLLELLRVVMVTLLFPNLRLAIFGILRCKSTLIAGGRIGKTLMIIGPCPTRIRLTFLCWKAWITEKPSLMRNEATWPIPSGAAPLASWGGGGGDVRGSESERARPRSPAHCASPVAELTLRLRRIISDFIDIERSKRYIRYITK